MNPVCYIHPNPAIREIIGFQSVQLVKKKKKNRNCPCAEASVLCCLQNATAEQSSVIHQYPISNEVGRGKWAPQECTGTHHLNWQIQEPELGRSF